MSRLNMLGMDNFRIQDSSLQIFRYKYILGGFKIQDSKISDIDKSFSTFQDFYIEAT